MSHQTPFAADTDEQRHPSLVPVSEAAAELTVAPRTLRGWIKQGAVPVVRMGGTLRIRREDVDRILRDGLDLSTGRAAAE
jgi:excisionase family DNA binding protein